MSVTGIICEYDPLHTGHAWLMARARAAGASAVVCAMSGNFTQRGGFAAADKLARAEMAVACGADLVLELPTVWAMSTAERFARGGVEVLTRTGVVTELLFGSESGDMAALTRCADCLDSEDLTAALAAVPEDGRTFAARRQQAVEALLGPADAVLLASPNNTLAVEYLRAIRRLKSPLTARTVRRTGAQHGEAPCGGFASASYLRQLLAALCEAVPGVRIRLGSLEPRTIDEAFCKTLSGYANLCPQFHLSLQSGSDTVLKRMHRKYDTARYLESVRLLRKYFPGCAVTTDLIVGFPGETEEEFAESLEFLKTCGLSMFHIFPYSRRKGTPAADMPDQIPNAVKERRAAEAASAAAELEAAYHASMLGTTQQVLFEQEENGLYAGHAMNYVKVYVQAAQLHNELRTVRVTDLCRDGVLGELE